jgi:hypothetical protein
MSSKEAGLAYSIQGEQLAHSIAVQLRAWKKNGNYQKPSTRPQAFCG